MIAGLLSTSLAAAAAFAAPSDESAALQASRGAAQREGAKLTLRTRKGEEVVFVDDNRCEGPGLDTQHCILHRLVVADPQHQVFVVENDYYEGRGYEWVSGINGAKAQLIGLPTYSPDGNHFVSIDGSDAGDSAGIQIWRVEGDLPTLEWSFSPPQYVLFNFRNWRGNDEIDLSATTYVGQNLTTASASLVFDSRPGWGWRVTFEGGGK